MQPAQPQNLPANQAERPYRSHLRPACVPCRRRKSRCQTEVNSDVCLMCRAHRTACFFPQDNSARSGTETVPRRRRRNTREASRSSARAESDRPRATSGHDYHAARSSIPSIATSSAPVAPMGSRMLVDNVPSQPALATDLQHFHTTLSLQTEEGPVSLGSKEDSHLNLHVVGPAVSNDSQILSDYLSRMPGVRPSTRVVIPVPAGAPQPMLFTMVQKRPVGVAENLSPAAAKLEIIEKIIGPRCGDVIDEYFNKVHRCFPLLDEKRFRHQWKENKSAISSALLACVYAHTMIYWNHSSTLGTERCPDRRFIWNMANEALYSELYLSPNMSVIQAMLLNIGGRPTTSLVGNGVLLGSAVSIAHSLGLSHSPLSWNISRAEKVARMRAWWALLVHDRWASLTHGTPPHISRTQYDVPRPSIEFVVDDVHDEIQTLAASVYSAFVNLTDVLDQHLQHIYHMDKDKPLSTSSLELSLNNWVESLTGSVRLIIIRGTQIDIPGAANLRLAYLTARLLTQRLELEADQQGGDNFPANDERNKNRRVNARRTCEDILMLTQELQPRHLGDFWLPISAFAYPTTVSFLLRCAVEAETATRKRAMETPSFRIAKELIDTLRDHQEKHGWDLGDICLAQHADIIDMMLHGGASRNGQLIETDHGNTEAPDLTLPDTSIVDHLFPGLWEPIQPFWS